MRAMRRERQAAGWYAAGRLALGACLVAAPRVLEGWVGPVARQPAGKVLVRAFGGRDAALGLGTLLALQAGLPVRRWLQLAAGVDAVDALVSLTGVSHLGPRRALPPAALGLAGAATGVWLGSRLP